MSAIDDKEILEGFRNEKTKNRCFEQLIDKYQRRIYWHVRKIVIAHDDADDVVQKTFIKAWSSLDGFREDSKLFTWMYRIATNEARNFLNKQKTNLIND